MKRLQFRRRAPGRSVFKTVFYDLCATVCWIVLRLVYRFRTGEAEHLPETGGVLVVANHQSYYDPVLVGLAVIDRPMSYLARGGLFKFKPFGWLISMLGAIPLKEDASDTAAMKAAIRALQAGRCVVIFPEGTRTAGGVVEPFKRGAALLIKRTNVPVVPVAVEGACDIWPPNRKWPSVRGKLATKIGHVITHEDLLADGADAALARLRREVDALRLQLRTRLREETHGRFPAPGLGDEPSTE